MSYQEINRLSAWSGPSALDLYRDFVKRYGKVIDDRRKELLDQLNGDNDPSPGVYEEYDSIRSFEPELHRMIGAWRDEAIKPFQEVLTDIAMRSPGDSVVIPPKRPQLKG